MKAPRCPHCKKPLPGMTWRGLNQDCLRAVLKLAERPLEIAYLAETYALWSGIKWLSARRAIERMEKNGILRRVGKGIYQVAK